jgi:hypothetical protein
VDSAAGSTGWRAAWWPFFAALFLEAHLGHVLGDLLLHKGREEGVLALEPDAQRIAFVHVRQPRHLRAQPVGRAGTPYLGYEPACVCAMRHEAHRVAKRQVQDHIERVVLELRGHVADVALGRWPVKILLQPVHEQLDHLVHQRLVLLQAGQRVHSRRGPLHRRMLLLIARREYRLHRFAFIQIDKGDWV